MLSKGSRYVRIMLPFITSFPAFRRIKTSVTPSVFSKKLHLHWLIARFEALLTFRFETPSGRKKNRQKKIFKEEWTYGINLTNHQEKIEGKTCRKTRTRFCFKGRLFVVIRGTRGRSADGTGCIDKCHITYSFMHMQHSPTYIFINCHIVSSSVIWVLVFRIYFDVS